MNDPSSQSSAREKTYSYKGRKYKKSWYYELRGRERLSTFKIREAERLRRQQLKDKLDRVRQWLQDRPNNQSHAQFVYPHVFTSNITSINDSNVETVIDSRTFQSREWTTLNNACSTKESDNIEMNSVSMDNSGECKIPFLDNDITLNDVVLEDDSAWTDVDEEVEEVSATSFTRADDNPTEYRSPEQQNSAPYEARENRHPEILKFFRILHIIFTTFCVVLRCQNAILRFIRDLPIDIKDKLPLDGRTLRPPLINHKVYNVRPGKMVYFGIENVLSVAGEILYSSKVSEIHLSVNIDGLPVYRNGNGVGFWPILGCIDDYPVFLIGLHAGKKKPVCPNQFLKPFVLEVKRLRSQGIILNNTAYRFVLQNLLMDAPARAYVLGIKHHNAKQGCSKCHVHGVSFVLPGVDKRGQTKKSMRYVDMNAAPRNNSDFETHYHGTVDDHGTIIVDVEEDMINEDGHIEVDESAEAPPSHRRKKKKTKEDKEKHHQHPSILSTIPGFDLVKDCPLDYMHLICSGVMKLLVQIWSKEGSPYRMMKKNREIVSERLMAARDYFPKEFQRKSEGLECLASWKATQYRSFALYIGPLVLRNILPNPFLEHFQLFVVCIRLLARRVDQNFMRHEVLQNRGNRARSWLRAFVSRGMRLYTEKFAVYNIHNLIHCADDYIRFGPVDSYSCFRFESCLGRIKRLVTGHCNPLKQVINKFSALLYFKEYGKEGNRGTNFDEEYFEVPTLYYQIIDEEDDELNEEFECFERMRFKNFVIRSDRTGDSFCVLNSNKFMQVKKILRHRETNEVRVLGSIFETIEPLFDLTMQGGCSSEDVGMVIAANLSSTVHSYYCGDITEKCFGLPLMIGGMDTFVTDDDVRGTRVKITIDVDNVIRHYYTYIDQNWTYVKEIIIISDRNNRKKMSLVHKSWILLELGLVFFPSFAKKLSLDKVNEFVDYMVYSGIVYPSEEVTLPHDGGEITLKVSWTGYKVHTLHADFDLHEFKNAMKWIETYGYLAQQKRGGPGTIESHIELPKNCKRRIKNKVHFDELYGKEKNSRTNQKDENDHGAPKRIKKLSIDEKDSNNESGGIDVPALNEDIYTENVVTDSRKCKRLEVISNQESGWMKDDSILEQSNLQDNQLYCSDRTRATFLELNTKELLVKLITMVEELDRKVNAELSDLKEDVRILKEDVGVVKEDLSALVHILVEPEKDLDELDSQVSSSFASSGANRMLTSTPRPRLIETTVLTLTPVLKKYMKRLDIPASSKEQILLLDRKMRIGNGDFDAATCSDFKEFMNSFDREIDGGLQPAYKLLSLMISLEAVKEVYIEWFQETEFYKIFTDVTKNWPKDSLPALLGKRMTRERWNGLSHDERVRQIVIRWLKTNRQGVGRTKKRLFPDESALGQNLNPADGKENNSNPTEGEENNQEKGQGTRHRCHNTTMLKD